MNSGRLSSELSLILTHTTKSKEVDSILLGPQIVRPYYSLHSKTIDGNNRQFYLLISLRWTFQYRVSIKSRRFSRSLIVFSTTVTAQSTSDPYFVSLRWTLNSTLTVMIPSEVFIRCQNPMAYQGIPLMNLTGCEIRSVLFGPNGRVEEWNLTLTTA
jgi:hypothetical protein